VRTLRRPSLRRLHRSPVRIDPAAARALVAGGALLIDVRRRDDRRMPLEGALRIEPDMMPERIAGFDRALPVVLACT
jgi:hypothetical protein